MVNKKEPILDDKTKGWLILLAVAFVVRVIWFFTDPENITW